MVKYNENLLFQEDNTTFAELTRQIKKYQIENPKKEVLSLGIGDVSLPIIKPVIDAMHKAIDDLSDMKTFKGYGNYYGFDFLKDKIIENEYKNLKITNDEIYISCGTKSDVSNILELFDINCKICTFSPTYPVYKAGALCLNRKVDIIKTDADFNIIPPKEKYDLLYICSPNNPLGLAYNKIQLQKIVDYCLKNNAIILYDNVYEPFIRSSNVPHSIYEVTNAKKVAIEFRSFSKTASFTGTRCSYYIIPNEIDKDINKIWKKRTINRYNGTDYIVQRGAEAIYLPESKKQVNKNIDYYLENAKILHNLFSKLNFKVFGGIDSPYLWIKTPNGIDSWLFFVEMLNAIQVIIVPGIIFGEDGNKYFRVSSLASRETIKKIAERIENYYDKKI